MSDTVDLRTGRATGPRSLLRLVPAPTPVMAREREAGLTPRQREVLDALCRRFDAGFARLTMAALAAELNCSLRTLYELAPSRDELVLVVIDRNLWRAGRRAAEALSDEMAPLEALRAYLHAASEAIVDRTEAFAADLATVPAAQELNESHAAYLEAVARTLLDRAVAEGDIAGVDTAAVARVLSGLARDFARPEVLGKLRTSAKEAADTITDLVLAGLTADHAVGA